MACIWLAMAGYPPNGAAVALIGIFMMGSIYWAAVLQKAWGISDQFNSCIPLGFGLSCLTALLLLQARMGTIVSAIGASGGAVLALQALSHMSQSSESLTPQTKNEPSLFQIAAAGGLATFLMANQLLSAHSLNNAGVDTTVNGWIDLPIHSNTVISLFNLSPGVAPISTLDAVKPLFPYHLGSYVLPAAVSTADRSIPPFVSYLAFCAPLGITLLLLPILQRLSSKRKKVPVLAVLLNAGSILLIYAIWLQFTLDSLYDPIWLLVTAPATLYACSMLTSGLEIGSNLWERTSSSANNSARKVLPLIVLVFILTLAFKFQIAYSIAIGTAVLCSILAWRAAAPASRPQTLAIFLVLLVLILLGCLQTLYGKLGIAPTNPFQALSTYLVLASQKNILGKTVDPTHTGVLISTIKSFVGVTVLTGPLFLCGWGLANSTRECAPVPKGILPVLFSSFLLGLLIHPVMPWDPGEFQNRSWPLFWCVGCWLLAGYRTNGYREMTPTLALHQGVNKGFFILICILAVIIVAIPVNRKQSIAAPLLNDWADTNYPLMVSTADKQTSRKVQEIGSGEYFFDPKDDPSTLLIAGLSGRRPLFSRTTFQTQSAIIPSKENKDELIKDRFQRLEQAAIASCRHQASDPDQETGPALVSISRLTSFDNKHSAWAICHP
jgi:hypothetical protein